MRLWIDASPVQPTIRVFGMGLVERHLRAAARLHRPLRHIIIDAGGASRAATDIPERLSRRLPLTFVDTPATAGARLRAQLLASDAEPVLAVSGDSLVDPRLFGALASRGGGWVARSPDGTVLLRLEPQHAGDIPLEAASLASVAEALLDAGTIAELRAEDFASYVRMLRRDVPFYLFTVADEAARHRVERFLFGSNYKGSTDVLTRYVYPPLVWILTQALARARVHPNLVTLLSIVLAFGAVPLFALGHFAAGLVAAYIMSVLDSVDGKLARLTFSDSRLGTFLDHGLDIVHPPLWYVAWAWGLSGGDLASPLMTAAKVVVVCYVLDRLVLAIYPARFKRGLHTHAPIDAFLRTFIARRNTNLIIITAGLLAGYGAEAFYVVVLWQALTLAYHAGRTFWILAIARAKPASSPSLR
jgi:phosphatidylglycerophosphate synthase